MNGVEKANNGSSCSLQLKVLVLILETIIPAANMRYGGNSNAPTPIQKPATK